MRIAIHAQLACCAGLLFVALSCATSKVEPSLVGTWELNVPNADGVARWVWDIHADGTYAFHAEGPGNVPSHSGTFEAKNGKYTLNAKTMAWVDDGTYQLVHGDTLNAAGKLGRAAWTRVQPVSVKTPADSSAKPAIGASPDTGANAPGGAPGAYSAATIYGILSHNMFDDGIVSAPLKVIRTSTVDPDAQEKREGVTGIVQADIQASASAATISLVVYRDRAAAEAAWKLHAIFDARTFVMKPGEFVSSHAYTYHERGEARCISRLLLHESSTATITCYLLVQYPTREPVIIESETTERVRAKAQEASDAAITQGDDLLFAGLKEWALVYPTIGRATTK
jgi:hypothetical protein